MNCPQCGKTFSAVQSICPDCYVELERPASSLFQSTRAEFPALESLQPRPAEAAVAVEELPAPPPPVVEEHAPPPPPEAPPPAPGAHRRQALQAGWLVEGAATPASPRRHPGVAEWILALMLLPGVWWLWSKVVQPLIAETQKPPVAAAPPPRVELPEDLNPAVVYAKAEKAYKARDYRVAASEAQVALRVWKKQGGSTADIRKARVLMARSYARLGQYDSAIEQYKMLGDEYRQEMAAVRSERDRQGRSQAHVQLRKAQSYYTAGDYGKARSAAQQALTLYGQFHGDNASQARCHSIVGRSLFHLGNYQQSIVALKQALTLNPGDSSARTALADARDRLEQQQYPSYSDNYPTYTPQYTEPPTPTRTVSSAPSRNYPTSQGGSSSRPGGGNTPWPELDRERSRPGRNSYNPDYSVPGNRYTPRVSETPDAPGYNPGQSGLPTYGDEDNGTGTLPGYNRPSQGGSYPGYNSPSNGGAPSGY